MLFMENPDNSMQILYENGRSTNEVFVDWTVPLQSGLQAVEVYNKPKVTVQEIFAALTHRNSVHIGKQERLAKFFVDQLYLCAEMCLGRNYSTIKDLERKIPISILIEFMKFEGSDELISAAANLVHHLYVDRKPQIEIKLPRYVNTFSQIENHPSFYVIDSQTVPEFGALHSIIVQHLTKVSSAPFCKQTLSIVKLLQSLVRFNLYGTSERLELVVKLVSNCLSRDDLDVKIETEYNNTPVLVSVSLFNNNMILLFTI